MPEIDLPPGKYRWRRPLSKPLALAYVAAGLTMLGWVYWWRDSLSAGTLFGSAALLAFCLGLIVAGILRDVD